MNKAIKFLKQIITPEEGVSSNRFLGVFIYTPVLIFLLFFKYPIEYIYAVIGLLTALLITNAAAKFKKESKKNDNNDSKII